MSHTGRKRQLTPAVKLRLPHIEGTVVFVRRQDRTFLLEFTRPQCEWESSRVRLAIDVGALPNYSAAGWHQDSLQNNSYLQQQRARKGFTPSGRAVIELENGRVRRMIILKRATTITEGRGGVGWDIMLFFFINSYSCAYNLALLRFPNVPVG